MLGRGRYLARWARLFERLAPWADGVSGSKRVAITDTLGTLPIPPPRPASPAPHLSSPLVPIQENSAANCYHARSESASRKPRVRSESIHFAAFFGNGPREFAFPRAQALLPVTPCDAVSELSSREAELRESVFPRRPWEQAANSGRHANLADD